MTTLKDLVYKILLENPECRDSDKKLIWEVWRKLDLIDIDSLDNENIKIGEFMSAPSPESCRRVRQQIQREDLLLGKNLVQPTSRVKKERVKLSNEKGASFIMGKQPVYNPEKGVYEI